MASDLTCLSDPELIRSLKALIRDERRHLVSVLRHLAEMDRRRLAHREGFPSLFDYCVRELRYAEGEAARRIHAARAAAKYPLVYRAIDRGLLSLTSMSLLAPHLRWDNHRRLLRAALGRNKRDVERLVASLAPATEKPERVRFVRSTAAGTLACGASGAGPGQPAPGPEARAPGPEPCAAAPRGAPPQDAGDSGLLQFGTSQSAPAAREEPAGPPGPQRVEFTFTADEALLAAVDRARELLRHKYPRVGFEEVFVEALRALLERIDPGRRPARRARPQGAGPESPAARSAPGSPHCARSRALPRWLKEEVWRRDGGRCAFIGPGGRRCGASGGLEYDHVKPWALGGRSDDPANVRLLCLAHNGLEARRVFGDAAVEEAIVRARREGKRVRRGRLPPPDHSPQLGLKQAPGRVPP